MITLIEIDGNVQGDSSTSLTIGTGEKTFVLDNEQPFEKGMEVTARYDDSNDMTGTIIRVTGTTLLIDITSVNGSGTYADWEINGDRTLYFGTETYYSKKSDSPSLQEYAGDISESGTIQQYMYRGATTLGLSELTKGDITINNGEARWDFIRKMGFKSGSVRQYKVNKLSDNKPTTPTFSGSVVYPDVKLDEIVFEISDRLKELDVPAIIETFDGTNSGPTGIEGNEGGIKGQLKPFCMGGPLLNVPGVLLNESKLIYGFNFDYSGDPDSISTLGDQDALDQGLGKTLDTGVGTSGNTADLSSLQSASISAGEFATCTSLGLMRFQGSPNGVVTANLTQSTMSGSDIVKALIERIGFTSSDYVGSTFDAVDADNSDAQELYVSDESTVLNLASEIMNGMGGYLIANTDNKFEVGLLKDPDSLTSVYTFEEDFIQDFEVIRTKDKGEGIPPKQIKITYRINHNPMSDSEFAGGVDDTDRLLYGLAYSESAGSINEKILRKHAIAPIFTFKSHFTNETDANTERSRQETLRQVEKGFYSFSTSDLTTVQIGECITLKFEGRMGLTSGQKFVIMGREIEDNSITYLIWGNING